MLSGTAPSGNTGGVKKNSIGGIMEKYKKIQNETIKPNENITKIHEKYLNEIIKEAPKALYAEDIKAIAYILKEQMTAAVKACQIISKKIVEMKNVQDSIEKEMEKIRKRTRRIEKRTRRIEKRTIEKMRRTNNGICENRKLREQTQLYKSREAILMKQNEILQKEISNLNQLMMKGN